jgi:hypothetical protein
MPFVKPIKSWKNPSTDKFAVNAIYASIFNQKHSKQPFRLTDVIKRVG